MKALLISTILLFSCGKHEEPSENHGDIVATGQLVITVDNHPRLYGEKNCFLCHQEYSIHREDRIESLNLDLKSIQRQVKNEGIQSCRHCHGNNDL